MPSYAWLIVWLPLAGFVFNFLSGFLFKDRAKQKRAVSIVAPLVVLGAFGVTLFVLMSQVMPAEGHRAFAALIPGTSPSTPWIDVSGFRVNFGLLLDPLSMLMAMIVTGVGGLIHIYATGYMADDPEQPRFFTYFNLFIFMMLLLVLGDNFLLMFVGWEGVGTCSYLLVSFWYTDVNNAKAGNKAFIVNRVGDLGFALGMMAIWSVFGTLTFFTPGGHGVMQLAAAHKDAMGHTLANVAPIFGLPVVTAICLLLFVGATGKSAQIPLWVWLPDAMAGPTPVSALIHAATMVTAGVVMVTRCSWLFVQAPTAMQVVGWIGLLTAFVGATIGLVQNDIKRVLAFSTVSQLGYMFLACGVGDFTAGMFHVTTHAFFKALLFLGSGAVIHSMLGEQDMRKMGGLKNKIKATWVVMFIGTYAIAGFPLLSGFWSKDEVLHSASASPWGSGQALYWIGIAIAFMTAFYMNRLMWKTFYVDPQFVDGELVEHHHSNFDEHDDAHGDAHGADHSHDEAIPAEHTAQEDTPAHGAHAHGTGHVHPSPPSMMWPLYILAAFSLLFGLLAGPKSPLGPYPFEKFLEPSIAPLSVGPLHAGESPFPEWMGYLISSLVAIGGLLFAYVRYNSHRATGELMPEERKARNPVYNFLMNKWYFDTIYNAIFIRGGGVLANLLWKRVDVGLIDRTVNVLAEIVAGLSSAGRRVQTGYVRNYVMAMMIGAVGLVIALIVSWNRLTG